MDFVTPSLLFGAAAAAVPVILHLVMRQQPQHLEFPALRFVQVRENANRRRLKLRHLLLLLLRVAALCLVAAALARPSIKASGLIGDQEAPVAAALVFDTSPRMDYKSDNQTRLEVAQEMGNWLLKQLPEQSLVAVIDSTPGEPVFQVDLGAAQQRVSRLETTAVPQHLWDVIEHAAELLKKGEPERKEIPERKELYIFSDLVKSEWDPQASVRLRQRLAEMIGLGVYVIDIGAKEPQNFALGELRLSAESMTRNRPWSIATELLSTGAAGERPIEVYLKGDGGEDEKRGHEIVVVPAGASQSVEFALGPLDTGTHQGYVRLVGADGLPADDRRWFTVDVKPPWKVLVAASPPLFDRTRYLTEALAPPAFRQSGRAEFDCKSISLRDLPQEPLEEYAVVCLLDPKPLDDDAWNLLSRYAESGGGVGIFLGAAASPEAFKAEPARRLLGGELGAYPRNHPEGDMYLGIANEQHPMMAKFRGLQGSVPWDALPVFKYWPLRELASGTSVLATYRNREPALVERPVGKGHVVVMTTPISFVNSAADERWNDLVTGLDNWPYLVLVNQICSYLAGSTDGQLNYVAGETAVLRLASDARYPTYLLTTPRGDTLRQSADPNQRSIVVTATQWVGNYLVTAGGEQGGLDRGFSVNLPLSASDLVRGDEDGLKQVFGNTEFHVAHNRDEIDRKISTGRVGRELFPLLMVLVALVLGAEHLLANRFYRGDTKG
ncbi:MAG TPA: BatA domain-containing protein [Pirellulales bacterium]|nr:BatA domain-containing protein [Pirellulales bacterium]